jgi:hypothetical protein
MYSAPSVSYPVERSRHAQRLLLAVWLCGAAVVMLAWTAAGVAGWRGGVLLAGLAVAAVGVVAGQAPPYGGAGASAALVFDGQYWSLAGSAPLARAAVALDLQALLLIRLAEPLGKARWVWAERRAMPGRWLDLRRALHARPVAVDSP